MLLQNFVTKHHNEQADFLARLVRVPSDNPPGDCAAHAQHTAQALTELGFAVEQHPVSPGLRSG